MPAPTQTVRLADEDLQDQRHICALVDGPEDAYELLMPFILAGFEHGDRALHIIDPQSRDAHLERLEAAGIDIGAATASRQLDVLTWDDSYMSGGRFNRSAQLVLLRRILGEGLGLGYPVTRAIGTMEWAIDADTVGDLLDYEMGVNDLLRRAPDVVICAYDINRHSARTLADVIGIHPAAVVAGVLRTSGGSPRPSARERLLAAASKRFHEAGIQATGVDALIAGAGVAKATFYRHFPSKDDLVVAWLLDSRTRWLDRVRAQAEGNATGADDVIPQFFDAVADWLAGEDYRGCPYLNTASEITDPLHPAQPVIRDYLQEVEDVLDRLLAEAGYRDSRTLAAELQALVAGSISLAVARRNAVSVGTAKAAALQLLSVAERR
jgi:AcrR family transcriptional regulator